MRRYDLFVPRRTGFGACILYSFFPDPRQSKCGRCGIPCRHALALVYRDGFTFGARVHLLVNERRYMATIAELNSAKSSAEKARICGEGCDPSSAQRSEERRVGKECRSG